MDTSSDFFYCQKPSTNQNKSYILIGYFISFDKLIDDVTKLKKIMKLPGLDDLPAEFYKTSWYLIGKNVFD